MPLKKKSTAISLNETVHTIRNGNKDEEKLQEKKIGSLLQFHERSSRIFLQWHSTAGSYAMASSQYGADDLDGAMRPRPPPEYDAREEEDVVDYCRSPPPA